ncbi:MAG: AAA family ATPase [Pyrinomonadaceae bacterium]
MKLILIYGPPAVGKLTVSNEIAALTGYKVFHNHLSIDCIEPIFAFGSPPFYKLIELIRVETVAEAARQNVNLIYTFCYAKDFDDPHVDKIINALQSNGGKACFVLLTCDRKELERRVTDESRRKFGKANNTVILNELLSKYDLFSVAPQQASLCLDTTNLSPQQAAQQIIEHYKLL